MADIPEVFNQPGAGFVLLPSGIKFPPIEKEWQKKAHAYHDAASHKGNVGILAGNGYIGLDQDDPAAFKGLELPITTKWETRPGRYGLWLKCSDVAEALAGIDKKADQAQLKLFKDGKPCGEVKLQRTYQVIPPSWKKLEDGTRADYKLLDSSPPAEIRLSDLLEGLQAIGITFSSKLEQNAAKLEHRGREARQKGAASDETRARHYAEAALKDEVLTLAGAPDGERNNQLNLSTYAMAQFIAAGVLTESEIISELTRAAENTGLDSEEIRKTILSALEAGKLHPRKIPEPDNAGKQKDAPKAEPQGPEVSGGILERIKADPRALKEPSILASMARMRADDPIEFDLLVEGIKKAKLGIKVETIANLVEKTIQERSTTTGPEAKRDESAQVAAYEILTDLDPIHAHQDYVTETVCGGEKAARIITMSSYSAFMNGDRLYADIVGGPQSGKSTTTITTLETFPEENVIIASEASPKSLYYLASQQPERLKDAIVYVDDARPEHIPVLKTFRNENNIAPSNLTVADGEFLELIVKYRPVVIASSVTPLRDLEGQATSRAFLASVPDATEEEEKAVRAKIKTNIATAALSSQKTDASRKTLQEMARILRDDGIKDVIIPFDVQEPTGADRRGVGQFMRLIKVSAFINQFRRPIIELQDGRRIVLAIYADLETAARVWFDFAEGQEFKISPKAIDVLKALPDQWPGKACLRSNQVLLAAVRPRRAKAALWSYGYSILRNSGRSKKASPAPNKSYQPWKKQSESLTASRQAII